MCYLVVVIVMSRQWGVNIARTHVKTVVKVLVVILVTIHVGIQRREMVDAQIVQADVQLIALVIAHLHAIQDVLPHVKLDAGVIVAAHANRVVQAPVLVVAVEVARAVASRVASAHVLIVGLMVVGVHAKAVQADAKDNATVNVLARVQPHVLVLVKMAATIGVIITAKET